MCVCVGRGWGTVFVHAYIYVHGNSTIEAFRAEPQVGALRRFLEPETKALKTVTRIVALEV